MTPHGLQLWITLARQWIAPSLTRGAVISCFFATGWSAAAPPLDERPDFQAAGSALADHLPGIAAAKLDRLLKLEGEAALAEEERAKVETLLVEALVRDRQFSEALARALASRESHSQDTAFQYWYALALGGSGQSGAAIEVLTPLLETAPTDLQPEIRLTRTYLLQRIRRSEEALENLEPLLGSEGVAPPLRDRARIAAAQIHLAQGELEAADEVLGEAFAKMPEPRKAQFSYLRGQLALARERPDEAAEWFRDVLASPRSIGHRLNDSARYGLGVSAITRGDTAKAADHLIGLIEESPQSHLLGAALSRLGTSGLLTDAEIRRDLERWRADESYPSRQALATYFSAVAQGESGNQQAAREGLEAFLEAYPVHDFALNARLRLAEMLLQIGSVSKAETLLEETRTRSHDPAVLDHLAFLEGHASTLRGNLDEAIVQFQKGLESASTQTRRSAAFNASLATIYRDAEGVAFDNLLAQIGDRPGDPATQAELILEHGLHLARNGDSEAFTALEGFLQRYPEHTRAPDAELALAELLLNEIPPRAASARERLESCLQRALTPEQNERLGYVALWVEDSAGDIEAVMRAGNRFLEQWPNSLRRDSVLMKLGEVAYREKDYSAASNHFERLAVEVPHSPFAESALFFAGRAASLSLDPEEQQRALGLWQQVVDGAGGLAAASRHEQGLLQLKLDDVDDAISTFTEALESEPPPPPELRLALLSDLGQAWFRKGVAEAADRSPLQQAMEAFDAVLQTPEAQTSWRNQATVRKAKCLEILGEDDKALELYYDLLENQNALGNSVEAMEWYFRAGFAAIEQLEKRKNWNAAVQIAERLAAQRGPRSLEAASLADRLRLEHFIWRD